ncbi:hypothetical protein CCACVL1_03912 [Corchorus capsularis]|uniref:Uncharacterized protein n=1 Tax=Corchorus capsularis TaxID=210143 RepID=A0A1R3JWD1_COCAP|nr:hypothetical protein CCACVL1_03912 [Corchorus capsularis]
MAVQASYCSWKRASQINRGR